MWTNQIEKGTNAATNRVAVEVARREYPARPLAPLALVARLHQLAPARLVAQLHQLAPVHPVALVAPLALA